MSISIAAKLFQNLPKLGEVDYRGAGGVITQENCLELTGFELSELFQVSGILGVHTPADLLIKKIVKYLRIVRLENTIVIEASTITMKSFLMDIFPIEKKIFFRLLESTGIEPLVGLRILLSQVEVAKEIGFKRIMIQAAKYSDERSSMIGYAVWAKFGFEMDSGSKAFFLQRMHENGRSDSDLYDLVQTEEGYEFWKKIGFEWIGTLDLDEEALSFQRFKRYIFLNLRNELIDDFKKE